MIFRRIRQEEFKQRNLLSAATYLFSADGAEKDAQSYFDEVQADPKSRQDEHWDMNWAAFLDDDKTMAGAVTAIPYEVNFDGHRVPMIGIGGVATLPPYRRMGAIRGCFEALLPEVYAQGAVFSYLYPFSTAYYRKFGYELGCDRVKWRLRLSTCSKTPVSGRCVLVEPGSGAEALLRRIDAPWQARYNMMVYEGAHEYRRHAQRDPYKSAEYTYIYRSAEGAPKAYFTWKLRRGEHERVVDVSRMVFTDSEGFYGLLNLMISMAADQSHAEFCLPQDVDLSALLPEWSMWTVDRKLEMYGMVRVVNAQEALRLCRTRGEGRFVLALRDEQIGENNGRFEIVYGGGRVQSVLRTDKAEDVSMGIAAFSRMITGRCDWDAYPGLPDVQASGQADALSGVFYRKPIYIHTPF